MFAHLLLQCASSSFSSFSSTTTTPAHPPPRSIRPASDGSDLLEHVDGPEQVPASLQMPARAKQMLAAVAALGNGADAAMSLSARSDSDLFIPSASASRASTPAAAMSASGDFTVVVEEEDASLSVVCSAQRLPTPAARLRGGSSSSNGISPLRSMHARSQSSKPSASITPIAAQFPLRILIAEDNL